MTKEAALPLRQFRGFDLGRFLPFRLTVLSNRMTRRVARSYGQRFKLSASEWRIIAVLGECGAMSANSVMRQTTMDKVRVSRSVAALLKAGYLTRSADARDRRRAVLDLTPKGTAIYRQIVPLVQEVEAGILASLSPEERFGLDRVLGKIEAQLDHGNEKVSDPPE